MLVEYWNEKPSPKRVTEADIVDRGIQVWDNDNYNCILTVVDYDGNYRVIHLKGAQVASTRCFSRGEMVDYLNSVNYREQRARVIIEGDLRER